MEEVFLNILYLLIIRYIDFSHLCWTKYLSIGHFVCDDILRNTYEILLSIDRLLYLLTVDFVEYDNTIFCLFVALMNMEQLQKPK